MTTLSFDMTLNVNKNEAWKVIADFAGISVFHPAVPKSYAINNTQRGGLGAERRCELSDDGKKYVDERIVRFVEGKEYDVEIYGGNQMPPIRNFVVTIGIQELAKNQVRVYLQATYQPKFGPIGMIMNMMMIKPFLVKTMNGILLGFKHHMTTGEPVQSFGTLQAAGLLT